MQFVRKNGYGLLWMACALDTNSSSGPAARAYLP
jgi:hypothetical protein